MSTFIISTIVCRPRKYDEMIGNHIQKGYYYDFLYNTFYPSYVITLFTGAEKKLG